MKTSALAIQPMAPTSRTGKPRARQTADNRLSGKLALGTGGSALSSSWLLLSGWWWHDQVATGVHIASCAVHPTGLACARWHSTFGGRMSQLKSYRTTHPHVQTTHPPQPNVAWPRRQHRLEPRYCAWAVLLIIAIVGAMLAPFL